jgi:hypothetical protein
VSTLLHAIVYVFLHNLLNVLVQIANKMGLQKKLGRQKPCGGGLEYLHHSPASHKRRWGPGCILDHPFPGDVIMGTWPSRLDESQMRR